MNYYYFVLSFYYTVRSVDDALIVHDQGFAIIFLPESFVALLTSFDRLVGRFATVRRPEALHRFV